MAPPRQRPRTDRPGHPEQNGRQERLDLTLKTEATRPAVAKVLQHPARFDAFIHQDNNERPHQALNMATPATRYQASARSYQGVDELDYRRHDWTAVVTACGRICYQGRQINLSQVFAAQKVGVRQSEDHIWLVSFMGYDLGYFAGSLLLSGITGDCACDIIVMLTTTVPMPTRSFRMDGLLTDISDLAAKIAGILHPRARLGWNWSPPGIALRKTCRTPVPALCGADEAERRRSDPRCSLAAGGASLVELGFGFRPGTPQYPCLTI